MAQVETPVAPSVVCFGEILWDVLPTGEFPGGAPLNVAYHLQQLGLRAQVVSAVGCDPPGEELLRRMSGWGLATSGVAVHENRTTGRVLATLSAHGEAEYEIESGVAWDYIVPSQAAMSATRSASACIFGSLSQRSPLNRSVLAGLLTILPRSAERVFDVNLRSPYDDPSLVRGLAGSATLLKLNAAEAARLLGNAPSTAPADESDGRDEEAHARLLAERWAVRSICITAGPRGAGLLRDGQWFWEPGRPVRVQDTVGAGDAFLAGFLCGHLRGLPPPRSLELACRQAEWVVTQPGATPAREPSRH